MYISNYKLNNIREKQKKNAYNDRQKVAKWCLRAKMTSQEDFFYFYTINTQVAQYE